MRKMMLLAVMVAMAAMMLAAAPALAQDGGQEKVTICHVPPGNPANQHTITVGAPGADAHLRQHRLDYRGPCLGIVPGLGQDGQDGRGFVDEFGVPFITQETEQECESGDIDQSFNVSQTGDNSNQTVGLQGTANTGCAQNVIDVVDAGPFVGDFDGNNNGNDGLICFVDENGDGIDDENGVRCFEDGNFFDDGLVFCDRDGDGKDDGDDECVVVVFPDFNDGGDQFFVNGNDDGDIEFEDVGANIDVSPTNTVNSSQQVNQAAAASAAPQWVLTAWGWMLV